MTEVHVHFASPDTAAINQQRESHEHQLENRWNGLLLNNFLNCNTSGAIDLWGAERDEIDHWVDPSQEKTAISSTVRKMPSPRDVRERELETNGNGLLINNYFNCDASSAEALFQAERDEMDRAEQLSPAETKTEGQKLRSPGELKRDRLERKLETDWNGLLINDWLNCDGSAVEDLWQAEREQLEKVSARKQNEN